MKKYISVLVAAFYLMGALSTADVMADVIKKRASDDWRKKDGGMITLGQGFQDIFYKFDSEEKYRQYVEKLGVKRGNSNLVSKEVITKVMDDLRPKQVHVGGAANNTAVGVAVLGVKSSFHTSIADDEAGARYLRDIKQYKLDSVITLFGQSSASTGVIMVLVSPSGERTMLAHPGISKHIPIITSLDYLNKFKLAFSEGYLLNEPGVNNNLVLDFFNTAKKSGSITAFTFGDLYIIKQYRKQCINIAKQVDIIFADDEQIHEFFHTKDWQLIKRKSTKFNTIFIVTFGAKGAYILSQGEEIFIPAEKVSKVVDATGAGDQFAAGFLYAFINGYDLESSGKLGAKMAAKIIQQIGAKPNTNS